MLSTSNSFDRRYRPSWANQIGFCFTQMFLLNNCSFCILFNCHPDSSLEQTKQLLQRHLDSTCLGIENKTESQQSAQGHQGALECQYQRQHRQKPPEICPISGFTEDHFLMNTNILFSSWILWLLSIQCNTVRAQTRTSLIRRIPFWCYS